MLTLFAPLLLLLQGSVAAPIENAAAVATVGKIRGVREPIYHLYLQANSKNGNYLIVLRANLFLRTTSINPRPWSRKCSR